MISVRTTILGIGLCLSFSCLQAQTQTTNEIEQLRQQLRQLQENFDRVQREHRQQIEQLSGKIEELNKQQNAAAAEKKLEQELANKLAVPAEEADHATHHATEAWSPADPLTVGRSGSAYMNLSFDALVNVGWSTAEEPSEYLQLGHHDPNQRGFSLSSAEITLDGAVDPYFKGFGNILFSLDENNETSVELEETYLLSTALPWRLQAKAGQFFAGFGRQNPQHPHQWAYVDQPLMLTRAFGPDGLRNVGGQVSWLAPTPFFAEASLGIFNGAGETAFSFRNQGEFFAGADRVHGRTTIDQGLSGPGDLLYVPRLATSFDLSESQTLVAGASAGFGPNDTGTDTRTQIYGVDLYWQWKAPHAEAGFPFLSWQTEALFQRFEAGADPSLSLPAETLKDWGLYSQVSWGFKRRWVAGLRGEYVNGNDGAFDPEDVFRGERTRVSPVLSFYPTEFSKVRLQYNYDHGELFGTEHSVWLQLEFLLGAHAHW